MDLSRVEINGFLICSITPYFLDRENFWFEGNLNKILEARKTQSFFQDNTLFLEKNQKHNFSQFLRKLDEMGYEKVQKIENPGEFSQRGGIIDVFPINSKSAVRFDFLGNKIEGIELLDIKIEDEKTAKEILKKKLKSQKLFSDLKGIKPGNYLVHLDHGIARFFGIEKSQFPMREESSAFFFRLVSPSRNSASNLQTNSKSQISKWGPAFGGEGGVQTQDYYVLEYAAGDKLYVPVGLERKLSRYIGFITPKISRLGSPLWQRTKKKIKEEAETLAKELLEIYAKREITLRSSYLPDEEIQTHISGAFKYEETPDQIQAIEDIKRDMEKKEPMDRLICGDVGFGKTEVALRAMIKAVISGRQVAMICPTTILSDQHFQNLKERLKGLPIKPAILTRLQTKKEQKEVIKELSEGRVDIVIGTHRLLSKDIEFKNLGLFIIDDEQRFGVKQKEKFKKIRASLDILSLSATPIPRTLYMTLSSLKDISLIQTPPIGRLPIKTHISTFRDEIIKKAIVSEISRKGQVYFLYNRVETIEATRRFLEKLVPKAKFGIAHGRIKEKDLVKIMADFSRQKIDVLVATTIIENGLDFPNVNTLIVADATRLGLSQAYQIRGRIGRSHIQAFAYFLCPQKLTPLAKERLEALKKAEELGAGYKIALKDLEIRGTGNILGKEQSGNINQVGLNLYCQILSEAVEKLKA